MTPLDYRRVCSLACWCYKKLSKYSQLRCYIIINITIPLFQWRRKGKRKMSLQIALNSSIWRTVTRTRTYIYTRLLIFTLPGYCFSALRPQGVGAEVIFDICQILWRRTRCKNEWKNISLNSSYDNLKTAICLLLQYMRYVKTDLGTLNEKTIQNKALKLCRHIYLISLHSPIISDRFFKSLYKNHGHSSELTYKFARVYLIWFTKQYTPKAVFENRGYILS